jgi:hypothetical protein
MEIRDPKIQHRDYIKRLFNPFLTEEEVKEIYRKLLGKKYVAARPHDKRFKNYPKSQ